jgi:hypothetical protein
MHGRSDPRQSPPPVFFLLFAGAAVPRYPSSPSVSVISIPKPASPT